MTDDQLTCTKSGQTPERDQLEGVHEVATAL